MPGAPAAWNSSAPVNEAHAATSSGTARSVAIRPDNATATQPGSITSAASCTFCTLVRSDSVPLAARTWNSTQLMVLHTMRTQISALGADGGQLLFYDEGSYYTYDTATGKPTDITKGVATTFIDAGRLAGG